MPPIAILCGGLATRLHPMTQTLPKSMLEVAGEPFIAHQLRLLSRAGFREVVLLCGFLGEQIQSFVGNGDDFGCAVEYAFDGPQLLGTGGAVRRALRLLGNEFMLVYGDSYLPTDYARVYAGFQSSGLPALMTVYHNLNQWDRSNVEFRNSRVVRYEKNPGDSGLEYIDYGLSAFRADVFTEMDPERSFDLALLQQELARRGELAGIEVEERFYEIGSIDGLAATEAFLLRSALPDRTEAKERQQ